MKPTRIRNLNICAELKLEMTEELERLYDNFSKKEEIFFESDEDEDCYAYARAQEKLYDGIMAEVKKLYPNLDIEELAEYYEEE